MPNEQAVATIIVAAIAAFPGILAYLAQRRKDMGEATDRGFKASIEMIDRLTRERNELKVERDGLEVERDRLEKENDRLRSTIRRMKGMDT
jgi:hypothetical protein